MNKEVLAPSLPEPGPLVPEGSDLRRVLFIGKSMSRSRCSAALVEALRAQGLQVRWLNRATLRRWLGSERADRRIRSVFRRFRPDLVFVFWHDLPLALLREFKASALTVSWVEEAMLNYPASEADYLSTPHVVATSNLALVERLREAGHHNASFLMSGFSPTWHHPLARNPVRDVAYIGGPGRSGQRAALLARIAERHSLAAWGKSWGEWAGRYPAIPLHGPVKPAGYRRICATSHIVLGLNEVNDIPLHFSNRTFLVLGCGGFHVTSYVPGLEDVFQDGVHLVWFENEEECLDKIAFYLDRRPLCRKIAAAGHQLVMREHRYTERVARILDILYRGFAADNYTEPGLSRARGLLDSPLSQAIGSTA